jgi:hypothetical protein
MGHIGLGILAILGIDAVLIVGVAVITLVFLRPMAGSARRQARRFAEAAARHDFSGAEAAAEQALTDPEQGSSRHPASAS